MDDVTPATFGAVLRQLRVDAGLTQEAVGRRVGYTQAQVANVENGRRLPPADVAVILDTVLDAGGLLADLAHAERTGDVVRRRTLLTAIATVAPVGLRAPRALGEALRASLMDTLGGSVDDWVHVADDAGRDYMTVPAARMLDQLAGDLLILDQHLGRDDHAALRATAARLAVVYGMAQAAAGDPRAAVRWYRTARVAADASGDHTVRVWSRGRGAYTRHYEGGPAGEVLALAGDAITLADGRPSLGLLEAYLAQSHAHAQLGAVDEAVRAVDDAYRVFGRLPADDTATVYAMPAWRLAMAASLTYSRAALVPAADRARDEARALQPAELTRWHAHLGMHRAILLAKLGDREAVEEAVRTLQAIPPEERTHTLILLAHEVLGAVGGRDTVAARQLLDLVGSAR